MGMAGAALAIKPSFLRSRIYAILIGLTASVGLGAAGAAHAAKIEHRTLSNGVDVILLMGSIEHGDDDVFRKLSIKLKDAVVGLDSEGGALVPAIEIGKLIRLAGYSTAVVKDAACLSSCALIWLAGSSRLLSPEGQVGFHASYRNKDGKIEETGVGNALVGHYLTLLNLPQRAVVFATTAPPDKFNWLSAENKVEAGIEFEELIPDKPGDVPQGKAKTAGKAQEGNRLGPAPPIVVTNVRTPSDTSGVAGKKTEIRPSIDQISQEFREYMLKPGSVREQFSAMGLDEKEFKVFEFHLHETFGNGKLIAEISKEIYNAWGAMSDYESSRRVGRQLGSSVAEKVFFRGLSRLPDEDIRAYFRYFSLYPKVMNDAQCSAFFRGNPSDPGLEFRAVSALGEGELEKFLSLYRRGISTGLSSGGEGIYPNEEQINIAKQSFKSLYVERIAALPDAEKEKILKANDNKDSVNEKDYCDSNDILFTAIYDLEGMVGNWFRLAFIRDISRD